MLQQIVDSVVTALQANLANLLWALAILIVGWLVAVIASAVVRGVMRRLHVNDRMAHYMDAEEGKAVDFERWSGRVVFWLIMLFVLVQFFAKLGLAELSSSLGTVSTSLVDLIPRIIGAGIILLIAWVVAAVVRFLVLRIADRTHLDERLAEQGGLEEDQPLALSSSLATAAFWLIFLFFLPAVLNTLGMESLVAPIQQILNELLAVIPRLIMAAVVLAVGWLVARILRQIVVSLLMAAGADRLGARVGLAEGAEGWTLSRLIGLVVYAFILITAGIAALAELDIPAISDPLTQMLSTVISWIPTIFLAALVLGVFYLVARFVGDLVASLLQGIGFDAWPMRLGFSEARAAGSRSPSEVAGLLTMVAIVLFGTSEAADVLQFEAITTAVNMIILFGARIFLAGVVLVIGIYLANIARTAILSAGGQNAVLWGRIASGTVIVFAAALALEQLGIGEDIVQLAFGLILGAVALAFALSVGLGSRETAGREVSRWLSDYRRESGEAESSD